MQVAYKKVRDRLCPQWPGSCGSSDWGGPDIRFALFLFGAMVGVQVLVYLHTPYDLDWHLATSLHRLCAQSWPVLTVVLVALSLDLLEHIFFRTSVNLES